MTDEQRWESGPGEGAETVRKAPGQCVALSPRAPEQSEAHQASGALRSANASDAPQAAPAVQPAGAVASNSAEELAALLARAAREVSGHLDALGRGIGELTSGRADRSDLARQIETFARQYRDRFPEVAAIADRLAKLLRHQAHLIERLQWASELLIAGSGRLADKLAPPQGQPAPQHNEQAPGAREGATPPEHTASR